MSDFSQSNSLLNKAPKTKEQYSRNIKKLKIKLSNIEQQILSIQKKLKSFENTSNDKMIAMKISKFCRQRRITPEMIFRCADRYRAKKISKVAFKDTLINLGMKLTQNQLTRLEYLLDQDISGQISQKQYNQFLTAFRIKGQFAAQDILLKQMFNKIDLLKLKEQDQDKQQQEHKNYKQLLNYEQFLKYCKRHYPSLKDKQIMAIFRKLAKDDKIDMDQFYRYIKKKKDDLKRIQEKNKNKQVKKQILPLDIDKNSLKGLIVIILKNRPKDYKPIFHARQFANVAKYLNKDKGQLLQIFREMDKQKKGSIGFNEIIVYYVQNQRSNDLIYVYELMGRKMYLDKQIPQDVINQYNDSAKDISLDDFKKFMRKQFGILDRDNQAVFRTLTKQNQVSVQAIINAMKVQKGQRKMVYIKPTLAKIPHQDFWKKSMSTILFNPFVALRFCLQIQEQLKKSKIPYWDDYQFGPSNENQFGQLSIGIQSITRQSVKWFTVEQLGMEEFYDNNLTVETSLTSLHDTFPKVCSQLVRMKQIYLWSSQKINPNARKIEQKNLIPLFQGTYPLIFQNFKKIGVYVFRFYCHQKWAYVIVDSKIPCTLQKQPLFSYSKNKKYSWISLIQKAYAKLKGSYKKLFNVGSPSQYIHQLCRKIPVTLQISQSLSALETINDKTNKQAALLKQKNRIWLQLLQKQNQRKQQKIYALISNSPSQNIIVNKVQTGLKKNIFYQLPFIIQLPDQDVKNKHKSHRLIFLTNNNKSMNQIIWNPNWNKGQDQNKFDKFYSELDQKLRKKKINNNLLKLEETNIINYKLFRSIFEEVYTFKKHQFQNMVILRKIVQFQKKFQCVYQLHSKMQNKQPLKMIVTLNKIRGAQDSPIQLSKASALKPTQFTKNTLNKNFGVFEYTISSQIEELRIKVGKWQQNQDYVYVLTFYMESALYHLRQLDRQQLFQFLGPYDEMYPLDISNAQQKQRLFLYTNYFKAADRGTGCCG